jgi:hypothetical protein
MTPPEPRSIPPEAPQRPSQRPSEAPEPHGTRVMRFGAAVAAVLLSSVVATMPAAVRIAPSLTPTSSSASSWVALLAIAFLPLTIATVALRHALAALRLFDPKTVATGVTTVLVWGLATFVALAGLGTFLRATTHHHGLAGVTFACAGVVIAAPVALFSTRFVQWAQATPPPGRWLAYLALGLALGAGLVFFGRTLGHSPGASTFALDVAAFAFAAAFGAGAFPRRNHPLVPLALAGPPLAAIVLVVGFGTLRSSPPLRTAVMEEAPVLGAAMELSCISGVAAPRPPH